MRRREFITLLGGATAAWPVAAGGQQAERVRRIGAFVAGGPLAPVNAKAFREGLETLGWTEGKNVQVEYRWTTGDVERLRSDAAYLVALVPEVIICGGTQATTALRERTRTIPIVFVHVLDPLSAGLVQSFARPGGNITGFSTYESSIGGKWLELLKEIAPHTSHVLVLVGQNPTWRMHVPTIERAAPSFNVQLTVTHVDDAAAIEPAIEAFAGKPDSGMISLPDLMLDDRQEHIAALAAKHRLPAIYGTKRPGGGLLQYSDDRADVYRRAASYVDRILKGAKPADLPVQQPTKYYLAINLNTARALGLTVPPTLLARADEVIE